MFPPCGVCPDPPGLCYFYVLLFFSNNFISILDTCYYVSAMRGLPRPPRSLLFLCSSIFFLKLCLYFRYLLLCFRHEGFGQTPQVFVVFMLFYFFLTTLSLFRSFFLHSDISLLWLSFMRVEILGEMRHF